MDKTKALQNLLKGKATKKEIELLKQALARGEILIGGDVNRSVVIIGSGNKVELTSEALSLLKPETTREEPVAGEPPYMGLRYFDTTDADLFYGREALTCELLARVQKETFLAIVGASGSGKSSVARAGLIPAWKKENERSTVHIITPTVHPLESLAASLTRESESVTATSTLMDDMKNDPRSLRLYVKKSLGETKLLLLVDQFEETFTLCKDVDERMAFIENLLSLVEDDGAVRVVITLRADFYAHCAEYDGLRQMLEEHQKYIGAMTPDELRQAITTPAQSAGWDFQPGLVDLILSDVGTEPGALPLLSHALLETWERRQGHTLTLKGYADAGGVKKAITQTAESVYDKLTPAEQTIARGIFLRLTELGEGTQDTRRRVKMDELAQAKEQDSVAKVLKTLTDARLVTTEQDSAEVAHEALIREWGTLRKWLDEDRESLRLHRQLTESAREWERVGRDEMYLIHRGGRLDYAITIVKDSQYMFSLTEQAYLDACVILRGQEAQEHERRLAEQRQYKMLQVALEITETMGNILDLAEILDRSLKKLQLLFENTNVLFLLYNKDENRLEFPPGAFKYYQLSNTLYAENKTFDLNNNSIASIVAKKSISTQKQEHILTSNIRDDGAVYLALNPSTMSELCVSLIGSNNDLIGVIALERASTDGFNKNDLALVEIVARQLGLIFERAKLAENLTFKSAVAAQSAWAVEVAHEVNRTVGSVRRYLYLLRETITNNAKAQEYLSEVEKIIIEISNLGARKENVEKEIILDDMLANYIGTLTHQMNIEFINQLNSQNAKVKINPKWLQQIVRHLIRNASQAMKNSSAQKILVRTEKLKDKQVEIIFQDYGVGVDEFVSSTLFQRKITTKGKSGYGLLLVRQVVEEANGIIRLLPSKSGVGATFSIVFPTV